MKTIYSVFQVNTYIHNMFHEDYLLSDVSVSGEISNLKFHTSGHIYFTLKDDKSAISCAIFRQSAQKLNIALKDGDKIVASGSISNYVPNGSVTFNVTKVEYEGVGDLTKKFEELKKRLAEQGLFDKEFKKPIPKFPKTIGIVTAPTGAAIRDIISVSKRRNPYISLILFPALVQGEGAKESIVKGIETLEKANVDVIIVGRGGGSLEDLWAFNEEEVAYAIFQCPIPIISAVGHEIDFTISDFTADLRAATPSAAAELAVPDIRQTIEDINDLKKSLDKDFERVLKNKLHKLAVYEAKLNALSPVNKLNKQKLIADSYNNKLDLLMKKIIKEKKAELETLSERLKGVSPLERLKAGMAYVTDSSGKRVVGVEGLLTNDKVKLTMKDGYAFAIVEKVVKEG
ncbi:Exodeoxyribonuclease VII large subunit [Lachnospiraceae bacterium G41]|nr:Exodeoxyribonuclease VII large subunit [Lachnospiraceae bacterium G41]